MYYFILVQFKYFLISIVISYLTSNIFRSVFDHFQPNGNVLF